MKESLKRLLCVMMALAVIFVFAACGAQEEPEKEETEQTTQETTQEETTLPPEEEKSLVGKWEGQIDMADFISDRVYENTRKDVVFDACLVDITVTFEEDGSYKTKLKCDFDEALSEFDDEFIDAIIEMSAAQVGMSPAQYERTLKAEGFTREDLEKEFGEALSASMYEMVKAYEDEMEGKWLLEGDELYLAKKKPEKADPYIITLEDETFTVTEITDDDDDIGDYFLPLTFTRA